MQHMQPSRDDYGVADSPTTLVPSSLRAYRHFLVYNKELWPCHNPHGVGITAPNPYRHPANQSFTRWVYDQSDLGSPPHAARPRMFEAKCNKFSPSTFYSTLWGGEDGKDPGHEAATAPQAECTCGFYAHYDPAEDFYADVKWVWQMPSLKIDPHYYYDPAGRACLVRAVVDLSGTTILGTRGVRAQRMNIIAVSADWSKYTDDSFPVYEPVSSYWDDPWLRLRPAWREPDPEVRSDVWFEVQAAANAVGAKVYEDVDKMIQDYPRPNIDHLLPKKEEGEGT